MPSHCPACGRSPQFGVMFHKYGCPRDNSRWHASKSTTLFDHPDLMDLDLEMDYLYPPEGMPT